MSIFTTLGKEAVKLGVDVKSTLEEALKAMPDQKMSNTDFANGLKNRGVLVISGHHFFPGLDEDWQHKHECLRITYSMQDDIVRQGIEIIADEVKKTYSC